MGQGPQREAAIDQGLPAIERINGRAGRNAASTASTQGRWDLKISRSLSDRKRHN